jgi:hypothetical protein
VATDIIVYAVRIAASVITLIAIIGCHRRTYYTPPPIDGLRFDARAIVAADTLVVSARAANTAQKYVAIEFDNCGGPSDLSVQLTQRARQWDSRVWETHRLKAAADSSRQILQVCAGSPIEIQMKPGSVMPYILRIPIRRILGDSLSGGRYRVTATLVINARVVKGLNAGEVELPPPNTR